MMVGYRTGDVWSPQLAVTEALSVELKEFTNCIMSGATPTADGQAGLRVVRILEAATESMRYSGRPVELSTISRCAI
jgi:predicted dehydrogenase